MENSTHVLPLNQADVAPELLEIPSEHEALKKFIHNSYGLKPALLKVPELHWRFAVREVARGNNLMILGPTGCGKTLFVRSLHKAFQRPFFPFNMGGTQDPRSTIIGNVHFDSTKGTYVAESYFIKAIQTPNAIILLDEMSRAHPEAMNLLMPVLDMGQRFLRIDERPDTPTIKVADGVTFIATANVGSEYTGTRTMDRAFLDRFTTLLMETLNEKEEIALLTEMFPTLNKKVIEALAYIAAFTRDHIRSENPKIDTIISTRITTETASLVYDGFSLREAAEVKIYPFFSDEGGGQSQRAFIKSSFQKKLPMNAATAFNPATASQTRPQNNAASPVGS